MILNTDRPIDMSPEVEREVDQLLARLDYLKRVRLARQEVKTTLAAQGQPLDTSELDRLLAQRLIPTDTSRPVSWAEEGDRK